MASETLDLFFSPDWKGPNSVTRLWGFCRTGPERERSVVSSATGARLSMPGGRAVGRPRSVFRTKLCEHVAVTRGFHYPVQVSRWFCFLYNYIHLHECEGYWGFPGCASLPSSFVGTYYIALVKESPLSRCYPSRISLLYTMDILCECTVLRVKGKREFPLSRLSESDSGNAIHTVHCEWNNRKWGMVPPIWSAEGKVSEQTQDFRVIVGAAYNISGNGLYALELVQKASRQQFFWNVTFGCCMTRPRNQSTSHLRLHSQVINDRLCFLQHGYKTAVVSPQLVRNIYFVSLSIFVPHFKYILDMVVRATFTCYLLRYSRNVLLQNAPLSCTKHL